MADGKIIIDTEIDNSGAEKDVKSLSSKLGSLAKTSAAAITGMVVAATTAVAALTKASVEQYAQYEQLTGGVETLFKNSSNKVMEYADNAYKSAGMSANEYMNTITGFSASLLQGLGGDTEKAAEIGNMAVTDMADNANKMGTAIENIQNAYQGFAKSNYTMLDNLKLGYGGTKAEMERLLADAEKLTGIKYKISNFSDIIEAIHVIQDEIGITGTTSKEAASTIEGSLNMTKSAWTNLLTGMADDNADFDTLVDNLVNSVGTLGENLLPRIEITLNGIGKLINQLLPVIVGKIPEILTSVLPGMLSAGVGIVAALGNGIINSLPNLINLGLQAIASLREGVAGALPTLIPTMINTVISMCDAFISNIPSLISAGMQGLIGLTQGIVAALPTLISEVPRIINSFANAIYSALPTIIAVGIKIIGTLIIGLIQSIPTLVANIPEIIMAIVNVFTLFNWWQIGSNLIANIGKGITSMVSNIKTIASFTAENVINGIKSIFSAGGSIGKNLISWVANGVSSSLGNLVQAARNVAISALNGIKNILGWNEASSIGKNLIQGLWNGISNMSGWILNLIGGFASSVISSIKGFFGIHSPSRVMRDLIGTNIVKGIGVGVELETPKLEKDIDANMSELVAKMKGTVNYEQAMTTARVITHNNILSGGVEEENKSNKESRQGNATVVLNIDGREFMRATAPYQDEYNEYYEGR